MHVCEWACSEYVGANERVTNAVSKRQGVSGETEGGWEGESRKEVRKDWKAKKG